MIQTIRDFLNKKMYSRSAPDTSEESRDVALASAALLIEVSRADLEISEEERMTILRTLETKFGMSREETSELIRRAEAEGRSSASYFEFTEQINREFSLEQKIRIVERMWEVAFADGTVSKYEEHLIRRVSGLLNVPHGDFIKAKLRVRTTRNVAEGV